MAFVKHEKFSCGLLKYVFFFMSADPRTDVNSLLLEATQKMAEKYHFYKSCLQVEIKQPENGTIFHQNNAATIMDE